MKEESKNRMLAFGLLAASTSLFFGYEVGIFNSFFQAFVEHVFDIRDPDVQIQMKGTVSFLFLFGGTICSLTGGLLYQRLGFYNTLILLCVVDIVTCFMFLARSMFLIYLARFVGGYFACMSGLLPSLLIKRHLPEREANKILPTVYIFLTFGILLAYWICVPSNVHIWGFVLTFPVIYFVPLTIILYFYFPESSLERPGPAESMNAQDQAEAVALEMFSKSGPEPSNPSGQTNEALLDKPESELSLAEMFTPEYKKQMYFAIFLNIANQLTGVNFLVYYSTDIFEKVNLPNPPLLTVLIGFANFAGGVVLTCFLGGFSKRTIMLVGLACQTTFMYAVVLGLWQDSGALVLVGCFGFMFTFAISLGGELGPYVVDFIPPAGFAMTGLSQWILACFIGKFAINVMNGLGEILCFFLLGTIALISTVVFAGYGVVTEGKTHMQIKKEFIGKTFMG